ncbi:MAG: hypothetical protein WAL77_06800 [Candidatus Dormiibacterota bacterium]
MIGDNREKPGTEVRPRPPVPARPPRPQRRLLHGVLGVIPLEAQRGGEAHRNPEQGP